MNASPPPRNMQPPNMRGGVRSHRRSPQPSSWTQRWAQPSVPQIFRKPWWLLAAFLHKGFPPIVPDASGNSGARLYKMPLILSASLVSKAAPSVDTAFQFVEFKSGACAAKKVLPFSPAKKSTWLACRVLFFDARKISGLSLARLSTGAEQISLAVRHGKGFGWQELSSQSLNNYLPP